jgi:hypothetical protein
MVATLTTAAGSAASIFLAQTLLKKFSGKGLVPDLLTGSPGFLLAVSIGAALTVLLAMLWLSDFQHPRAAWSYDWQRHACCRCQWNKSKRVDKGFVTPRPHVPNTLDVSWTGEVFDCDFNQMLKLNWREDDRLLRLWDINPQSVENRQVLTGDHRFGCTAGAGSSCGGALL